MAMPVKHIRIEFFGTLLGGNEVWSCGHSMQPVASGTTDVAEYALTCLARFDTDFWGAVNVISTLPPQTALLGCRAYAYKADGSLEGSAQEVLTSPHAGGGGGGSMSLPPQCSIVCSLRTPLSTAQGRGRMYLPAPTNLNLQSTGRILVATRDAWALALQDYFDTINAAPTLTTAAVVSQAGGFVTSITEIRVGDVVDTQRRRRDALPESYKSQAITI